MNPFKNCTYYNKTRNMNTSVQNVTRDIVRSSFYIQCVEYLESGSRRSSEASSCSSKYKSESFARRELDRPLEQKQVREVRSMTARLTARAEGSQRASLKESLDSRLERLRETGSLDAGSTHRSSEHH